MKKLFNATKIKKTKTKLTGLKINSMQKNKLCIKKGLALIFFFTTIFLFSCQTKEDSINSGKEKNTEDKIKVAVFTGNGASKTCILESLEALRIDTGIIGKEISAAQIQNDELNNFDVIIFPGGSGSKELLNLGETGKQKVHEFIKEKGGGIVGICAGGYLLSKTPTYPSLKLADVMNIDREHYARGRGLVEFKLSPKGKTLFSELKNQSLFLQYYDGPVLEPTDSLAQYDELATYVTDIHANKDIPHDITPGTGFMLSQNIGKGKLFIIAGHPESTPGMRWIVPRMVRIVSNNELISYKKRWIRPEINDKEIMFTADNKEAEKNYFWQLLNDTADVQINAMKKLFALRSRPAVRWNLGLLRSSKPEVRAEAARLLAETEYTFALTELVTALKYETNKKTKTVLIESIKKLTIE